MKEINFKNFRIYEERNFDLKPKACFVFEIENSKNDVEELSQKFSPGMLVELPAVEEGMNKLFDWNAEYFHNFTYSHIYFQIKSWNEFDFQSKTMTLSGSLTKEMLNEVGYESLFELSQKNLNLCVVLVNKRDGESQRVAYLHTIYFWDQLNE